MAASGQGWGSCERGPEQSFAPHQAQQYGRWRGEEQIEVDLAISQGAQANLPEGAQMHLYLVAVENPTPTGDQGIAPEARRTIEPHAMADDAATAIGSDYQGRLHLVGSARTCDRDQPPYASALKTGETVTASQFHDLGCAILESTVETFAPYAESMIAEWTPSEDWCERGTPSSMSTHDGDRP